MNMREPSSAWDRNPTDAELHSFYGKPKSTRIHDEIVETITETLLKASHTRLFVPYVKHNTDGSARIAPYPIAEVVTDYGTDKGSTFDALMDVLEASTCPLVAAYRKALAERFADSWADEVEELSNE